MLNAERSHGWQDREGPDVISGPIISYSPLSCPMRAEADALLSGDRPVLRMLGKGAKALRGWHLGRKRLLVMGMVALPGFRAVAWRREFDGWENSGEG